ncbi:hypothetical protein SAMN05880574_10925 [Chryseobacterium sp. RU37D]|uniref:hypothetical protein n=1 Tax=Chryseobacterium sp. RU37D TaxID=1907397 RepID=UPI0009567FA0|nr:hypothetical protein [Chryseobacterium sp. RU37D]SIQ26928.1 hypothetical protein SAMN05880574_10925 [Chryseobacterium sp. RU37D]
MIRKNIINLCLVASLSVISCKKNETRPETKSSDSFSVSQSMNADTDSAKNSDSVTTKSSDKESAKADSANVAKSSFEGKYVGTSPCEPGRFSIEIKSENDQPKFKIFDKAKVIASGNASIGSDGTVLMGEIGAQITGDKMLIQNMGNSMNAYQHFDCPEKYLNFIKQK